MLLLYLSNLEKCAGVDLDVLQQFRKMCLQNYELDPWYHFSSAGFKLGCNA